MPYEQWKLRTLQISRPCLVLTVAHVCRAELAEQEAALEAAQQEQQDVEVRIQAAGQRFAKTLARLEDDQAALAQDQAEQVRGCCVLPQAIKQISEGGKCMTAAVPVVVPPWSGRCLHNP